MIDDDDKNFDAKHDIEFGDMGDFMDWTADQGAKFFKSKEGQERLFASMMDMHKAVLHMHKDFTEEEQRSFQDIMEKVTLKLYP